MANLRRKRGESRLLRYLVLGGWALLCLAPILWFLTIGFRPRTEIVVPEPIYWPTFSLDAWRLLMSDWPIAQYLRNSVVAVAGSVVIDLVLAIPAAYALSRYEFKGRDDIGFYILSTRMMAPAIVAVPIFFLFRELGLLNTVWALMLVYAAINLSLVTWIIRSYMLDIPKELEDAARTDGAGDLTILREIIVPACLPGIITAAVIAAIFAINEFLFTLLIASTSEAYTMSVALANFTGGSDGVIYNAIALVSFLAFVPILILVILIQKHLSRGLTMGAVKG
ncbi:carbohydrate ABC transporter permease [Stappia sp.]|jgi:multiple sugar transport system permease protein|uniref:carbohydrate ABC transporter permease n=1 Tax=Stappia sp. TaxID=1870903 RepID=UPI003A98EE2B